MFCILCIPCRNIATHLEKIFKNIDKLNLFFNNFQVCFFYDKSNDKTLKLLNSYKKNKKYKINIIINQEGLKKYRTHRIAYARNKLIQYIFNLTKKPDYFIMMDCDEICSYPININSLKYHLELNNWDALSFNRFGLPKSHQNYDIWALQYEPFIHHCHSYYGDLSVVFIMRDDITNKLNNLKKGII